MIESTPRIVTGILSFTGAGYGSPITPDGMPTYVVPDDKRTQIIYLRAGNSADEMIVLILMRDGNPMRLFPLGAKSGQHVPLAVLEDLYPDTTLALQIAAPEGVSGTIVVDMGLVEI